MSARVEVPHVVEHVVSVLPGEPLGAVDRVVRGAVERPLRLQVHLERVEPTLHDAVRARSQRGRVEPRRRLVLPGVLGHAPEVVEARAVAPLAVLARGEQPGPMLEQPARLGVVARVVERPAGLAREAAVSGVTRQRAIEARRRLREPTLPEVGAAEPDQRADRRLVRLRIVRRLGGLRRLVGRLVGRAGRRRRRVGLVRAAGGEAEGEDRRGAVHAPTVSDPSARALVASGRRPGRHQRGRHRAVVEGLPVAALGLVHAVHRAASAHAGGVAMDVDHRGATQAARHRATVAARGDHR